MYSIFPYFLHASLILTVCSVHHRSQRRPRKTSGGHELGEQSAGRFLLRVLHLSRAAGPVSTGLRLSRVPVQSTAGPGLSHHTAAENGLTRSRPLQSRFVRRFPTRNKVVQKPFDAILTRGRTLATTARERQLSRAAPDAAPQRRLRPSERAPSSGQRLSALQARDASDGHHLHPHPTGAAGAGAVRQSAEDDSEELLLGGRLVMLRLKKAHPTDCVKCVS